MIRDPGWYTIDASLYKWFTLHENIKLRFNATAINLFNHPTWAYVNDNISDPSAFGVRELGGQYAGARTIRGQIAIVW